MIRQDEVYKIGRLGKPHGIKGEITFAFDDDVFDRTEAQYLVLDREGILVPFFMEHYIFRGEQTAVVKFCDVDTAEQARLLTGSTVYFPRSKAEDDDTLTWAMIEGYTIIDSASGRNVGVVTHVDTSTLNTLFEVQTSDGKDMLIPASEDLIENVDKEARTITVAVPEGLTNL